jgi:precorrin-6B C5,15-methyltransferase / cobalt-precorrin-6B C5,C15-methyltransferase
MANGSGSCAGRRVLVVGVGDDGPGGLPSSVRSRIEQADLLVGGRRHLELFDGSGHDRLAIAGGLDSVLERVASAAADGQVVVLASGDPCYFGIGPHLAERIGRDRVEIVPHVSSVALAFARLGIAWQDATVVSAHGRPLDAAIRRARGARKLAMLTDDVNTPGVAAAALLAGGADDCPAWVFEHLGGTRELAVESTLSALVGRSFASLNVLVIPALSWGRQQSDAIGFGLPESAYEHTAGLITKPEVRAVSLSKLRLPAGGVLWDVGAGSGSLAIEAAGLVSNLRVYAVERSARQLSMLRANVSQHVPDGRVGVIDGEAPDALAEIESPDAVFVGGSGGRLTEILDVAFERISRPGRIVANLVTFENVATVLAWSRRHDREPEVVQVSIARGADILGMTRLQAENPVTIVTIVV